MHLMQLESVLILERKLFEMAFLTILLESQHILDTGGVVAQGYIG